MDIIKIDEQIISSKKRRALLQKEIEREEKHLNEFYKNLGINKKRNDNNFTYYTSDNLDYNRKSNYKEIQNEKADFSYFNKIQPKIDQIPDSNGCRYYSKREMNIAIVTDEFMLNYYKDSANFIYLDNKSYKEKLSKIRIDFFLFVTGWKGLNNEWRGIGTSENKRKELLALIDYVKSLGVPTVFQSIEDPSNYENFLQIAKKCDYIFTTAVEKVEAYKKDCLNENVWVLEFGVNPLFHNPIGFRKFKSEDEVFFAGSWSERYKERCIDMEKIFDGVIGSSKNLRIVDRNFHLKSEDNYFPEKYLGYCSPSLTHLELQKAHKLYDWAINLNSIKYSKTMCAMRVYEMQALGNIILSNYSISVNNNFPNIFIVNDSTEVGSIIDSFSDEDIYKHQLAGIRTVMSNCTVFDRFEFMIEKVGFERKNTSRYVLVVVDNLNNDLLEMFNKQTYEHKKIISKEKLNEKEFAKFDIVTFFSPNIIYSEYYLEDMCNAFKYTNSTFITKASGVEHDYVSYYNNKYLTLFWRRDFELSQFLTLKEAQILDNGYSIDPHEIEIKIPAQMRITEQLRNEEPELSVVIPVFNNGNHLLYKCFKSLKRSSIFHKMEILLIDDGSNDPTTRLIIDRLANEYSNVVTYFFDDNGSGSASRPRNKGIELAKGRFITFLDPDNEAVNDGYSKLYKEIIEGDYDLVVGNIKKVTDKETVIRLGGEAVINAPRDYLLLKKFKAQSIQAAVIDKKLIDRFHLDMVVGAIGQDTLFFHELMLCASKVKVIDETIHIYYGLVEDSAVNKINKSFFQKSLILEEEAVRRYEKYGVLENYKKDKFEFFFVNWYLEKFKLVSDADKKSCSEILMKIISLYNPSMKFTNKDLKSFIKLYS